MSGSLKSIGTIGMLLCMLGLAACGSPAPTSSPTLDLDPLRTSVAATVFAQVTQALAQTPSATSIPTLTATPAPSSTSTLESSPAPSATATLATGTAGAGTVDLAQWVNQSIADDTTFAPGEAFTMTWSLKNAGTSTWTANYMLRFFSGNTFGAPKEILLGRDVPPGETIDITVKMTAPTTPGNYRSDWVMANASRSNFKESVFLKIIVPAPATSTPKATP